VNYNIRIVKPSRGVSITLNDPRSGQKGILRYLYQKLHTHAMFRNSSLFPLNIRVTVYTFIKTKYLTMQCF